MAKKSDIKPQKRTKCTKTAVKTAKKPVLRENLSAEPAKESSQETTRSKLDNFGGKIYKFEAGEKARTAGAAGGRQKGINAALRRDLQYAVAKGDRLAKLVDSAMDDASKPERIELAALKMTIAEKAAKLVGATHDQSPDAKQNLNINADVKKAETVKLVIEDFTKPEADGGAGG